VRSVPPFGEASQRLTQLEELLRLLDRTQNAFEAALIVERRLPALMDADEAALYLVDVDQSLIYEPAAERWRTLAASAIAHRARLPGRALTESRAGTIAAAIGGPAGPIGAVVVVRTSGERLDDEERRLLQLFAEHAGATLRRFASPASV
jgi:hypothetical protein